MSLNGQHLKDEGSKYQAVLAGGFSGLTARFFTAPLDVVKIHLQIQPHDAQSKNLTSKGIYRTFQTLHKQGGIKIFWRGNVSASWLYVVYNTTQFSAYRSFASTFDHLPLLTPINSVLSGAFAGAIATATAYPFDLMRTRFAAQGTITVYKSFRSGVRSIYEREGVSSFYRGLSVAVCQGAPYMGLLFGSYEGLRPVLSSLDMPFSSEDAVAGAIASVIAKTGTYPLDLIRKRIQMQGPSRLSFADGRIPEYQTGFWKTGKGVTAEKFGFHVHLTLTHNTDDIAARRAARDVSRTLYRLDQGDSNKHDLNVVIQLSNTRVRAIELILGNETRWSQANWTEAVISQH